MDSPQCYCGKYEVDTTEMVPCSSCNLYFHTACFKTVGFNPVRGDIFYQLTCEMCSTTQEEIVSRMKLQWLQVVYLTLYNLPKTGFNGKSGYFRWRDHICTFIDKHWTSFFGHSRKKTSTWCGTVAGTLSQGCPSYFTSGYNDLKESGWWKLTHYRAPTIDLLFSAKVQRKTKPPSVNKSPCALSKPDNTRSRRTKPSSYKAAMELKAKRMNIDASNDTRPPNQSREEISLDCDATDRSTTPQSSSLYKNSSFSSSIDSDLLDQDSCMSFSSNKSGSYLSTQDINVEEMPDSLFDEDNSLSDSDFEVDPLTISPTPVPLVPSMPPIDQLVSVIGSIDAECSSIDDESLATEHSGPEAAHKTTAVSHHHYHANNAAAADTTAAAGEGDSASTSSVSDSSDDSVDDSEDALTVNDDDAEINKVLTVTGEVVPRVRRKRRKKRISVNEDSPHQENKCIMMSSYEEKQLLRQLQSCSNLFANNTKLCRLKRKLCVRQAKREHGIPVFNIDEEMRTLIGCETQQFQSNQEINDDEPVMKKMTLDKRILDRYYQPQYAYNSSHHVMFLNRLVGSEDDQLQCIRSPYTHRLLKPFIRRDYESRPLKLRLLMEIQAYPHRSNSDWLPPKPYPIDFCYVRPEHIASVNTLCRQFFWPAIDLAECLQYPDFSCVVLYRRFVIGFAFMVPDVEYNKAYISFAFTHPEWRNAGIATFMIYHLIQTNMGKDITLHVSASNPAMLLYQKFGFKPQEFIQDFYDKYFPVESKECRHAFLLRLTR